MLMEKIALVTDSTSDLTPDLLAKHQIHLLPLKVVYKDREYSDRVDISPQEVYDRFEEEIPTTSMPSPGEILQLFEELKSKGFTHAICMHISSGLSGTCDTVRSMAQQVKDFTVEVVDSRSLSMGLGLQVLEAAHHLADNLNFHQVVEKARDFVPQSKTFFVLKTLKYLRQGGRIGYVKGTLGEILQVKPIISINDEGKYHNVDQTRGRAKSLEKLYEMAKEKIENGMTKICVCHGDAETEALELLARLRELKNVKETFLTQISPVMVVHTGPGLVGVTMCP